MSRNTTFFQPIQLKINLNIMNIQISNLSPQTTRESIAILFARYNNARVSSVRSVRSIIQANSGTFAYVEIDNNLEAEEAIQSLNGCMLDGKRIKMKRAN
jgi:RNA recognition motif-containing protein